MKGRMKGRMKKRNVRCIPASLCAIVFLYCTVALSTLSSCTPAEFPSLSDGEREKVIALSISVPKKQPTSLALGERDEYLIRTIDILSFDENGLFDYHTTGQPANTDNPGSDVRRFNINVRRIDQSQTLVIIANAQRETEAFLGVYLGNKAPGIAKNDVFTKLKFAHKNGEKWGDEGSSFVGFPMWGESEATIIANTQEIAVSLLRMVARMDVMLTDAVDNFKIESITLRNAKREGYIVPDATKIEVTQTGEVTVTAPSSDRDTPTHSNHLSYYFPQGTRIVNTIYAFEAIAAEAHKDAICLIVGGIYDTDTEPTYYRIDFHKPGELTYRDILRNHCYTAQVSNVTGRGHKNEDEAFNSRTQNLTVGVFEWNQGDIGSIIFDRQYFLSANKNKWNFTREARMPGGEDNLLVITTNYPEGWRAECSEDWLALSTRESITPGATELYLLLKENIINENRVDYITITAGRLKYIVKVAQNTSTGVEIEIVDQNGFPIKQLTFGNNPSEKLSFFIRYKPVTQNPKAINLYPIKDISYNQHRFNVIENSDISIPGLKAFDVNVTQPLGPAEGMYGAKAIVEIEYNETRFANNIYFYQKQIFALFTVPMREIIGWPHNPEENEIEIMSNTTWTIRGDRNGILGNISTTASSGQTGNAIYDLGTNIISDIGSADERIILTLDKGDASPDTAEIVVKAITASLTKTDSTVTYASNSAIAVAELNTNIPKSALNANFIQVAGDTDWVKNLRIEYKNDKFYLIVGYLQNQTDADRIATITVSFGLDDKPENKLIYTLSQSISPYILLPGFGLIRRYDDHYPGGNNWHYAVSGSCPQGTYLPNENQLTQLQRAYDRLSATEKARYNIFPGVYWSSTERYVWPGYNGVAINLMTSTNIASPKDYQYSIRCVKNGEPSQNL